LTWGDELASHVAGMGRRKPQRHDTFKAPRPSAVSLPHIGDNGQVIGLMEKTVGVPGAAAQDTAEVRPTDAYLCDSVEARYAIPPPLHLAASVGRNWSRGIAFAVLGSESNGRLGIGIYGPTSLAPACPDASRH
jgi:hypothetical protein